MRSRILRKKFNYAKRDADTTQMYMYMRHWCQRVETLWCCSNDEYN